MLWKTVLVTVGTTSFDELIKQVDTKEFLTIIKKKNYNNIIIQIGRGYYIPFVLSELASTENISFRYYRYDDNYNIDVENADLIISHAGAGSIMDGLGAKKEMLVVVNETLMGNHQKELADALEKRKYLLSSTCKNFLNTFSTIQTHEFLPYPPINYDAFPSLINEEIFDDEN